MTTLLSGASSRDIPMSVALAAHRMSSFVPEQRAAEEKLAYISHMESVETEVRRITDDEDELREALTRYREGYLSRCLDVLRARSRSASAMITGPSNFPTSRNRKALDREQSKIEDLLAWHDRAMRAMKRDLKPFVSREDKLAKMEAERKKIKAMNKIARGKSDDKVVQLMEMGATQAVAEQLVKDRGLPSYMLTNLGARIRNEKKRIEIEAKRAATPTSEAAFDGGVIISSVEEDRVQIKFDDKPAQEMRSALKKRGFRWAPSQKAWQRKRTANALYDAKQIVGA